MAAARRAGLSTLGGALSPTLPDQVGGTTTNVGRAVARDGSPIVAPWMRASGARWGCTNNPSYRAIVLQHARAQLDAGVDYFTIDDANFNAALVAWGGCYCSFCRDVARAGGANLERDMVAFQTRATVQFYHALRPALDQMAGRHVTLASNNHAGKQGYINYPFGQTDFGMSEYRPNKLAPEKISAINRAAELAGHPQVLTLVSADPGANRRTAAWCYATGGNMIVRWDVFQSSGSRIYGAADNYSDIFRFARRLGPLLDRAAPAPLPPSATWNHSGANMSASLRGDPGRTFAVLHLVAWEREGAGQLRLDPAKVIAGAHVAAARVWWPGGFLRMGRSDSYLVADVPTATWLAVEMRM
jgi:hypothetical protein